MTDYKRMVSYMYQYENGLKRRNVGFANVEAKGGECKFTLHMQLLGQLDSVFPTYLIQKGKGGIELIYLGDAFLKNQVMDTRLSAEENNIMGSGHKFTDMSGLLIFYDDKIFYATIWDDSQIDKDEIQDALRPKRDRQESKVEKTASNNPEQDPLEKTESATPPVSTVSEEINKEQPQQEQDVFQEQIIQPQVAEVQPQLPEQPEPPYESEDQYEDEYQNAEVREMDTPPQPQEPLAAKRFFEQYPRIYPFEDSEVVYCVKIEPKDISLLMQELSPLANNSFLLHGYYCYHHLIFAKFFGNEGIIYVIGVPGIYHGREQFMARMYGFECFKSTKRRELRQGDFGYWYLPVML